MSSAPRQTSATPILDRLVPVPPPLRPKSDPKARWSKKFLLSLGIGSAVLAILLLGRLDATWADVLTGRAPLFKFLWTILVRFVLPLGVAVLIHECGHLITGLFVGYRFLSIRVGPLELAWPFRLSVSRHKPGDVAGLTRMGPRILKAASIRAIFIFFWGIRSELDYFAVGLSLLILFPISRHIGGNVSVFGNRKPDPIRAIDSIRRKTDSHRYFPQGRNKA